MPRLRRRRLTMRGDKEHRRRLRENYERRRHPVAEGIAEQPVIAALDDLAHPQLQQPSFHPPLAARSCKLLKTSARETGLGLLKTMSSRVKEKMRNSQSSEFPIKSEMEDPFPNSAVKSENGDVDNDGLFVDRALFMDADMEFKEEPIIFEPSEGDAKYSSDSYASVGEEDLQIGKRKVIEEEESVKTGVKEKCLQSEESVKTGVKEECLESEEHIEPIAQKLIHTGGEFRCRKCGKKFSEQVDLEAHYETHTRRRSFKCGECGKEFFRESFLADHLRTHTGKKSLECFVCNKAFSNKSDLRKHYRTHIGEKPFKCSICDRAFYEKHMLTSHFRIHTGEKPFNCSVCDRAFSNKAGLTKHYRIHPGKRLFKCSVCDKAFSKRNDLAGHFRIHTGVRIFKCDVCDKAYHQSSHLTAHSKIHTGEKHKCSNCGMAYAWKANLARHMKICPGENL